MDFRDILLNLCVAGLKERGVFEDSRYKERLKKEIKEIDIHVEHEYFLELYDKKKRFPYNEHNLLIPYLLGIVDDFDITKEPATVFLDWPDIDIDYLPIIRDYLKKDWAPRTFGEDRASAIGTVTTYGLKSSLIDMARVHGKDRNEILALTTKLQLKDDEGDELTFDKALELYPELKTYCEQNPDVADATKRLVGRAKTMGTHAGGLIISKSSLTDLVPLFVGGKNKIPTSSFVEGLHSTDLSPLGLVKFDLLVVDGLEKIGLACKLVKERHGIKTICALPGQHDWSDTSYLNDPKALELANKGQLKCIFQFDSDGIRTLVKEGTVTRFDDLVAYSSIYRPGPLNMEMDKTYIRRKRGVEQYELHPILEPILGVTYGVMCYQEQVMKILNAVGDIPLIHCEKIRKAISKKKEKEFAKYKDMFIANGQKNLGWPKEQIEELWAQIESFAEYGFNKSHAVAYAYISARQLWLKAHYPIEFFAATLSCIEDTSKIKEYRMEAERCGVKVNEVHVNKSGWNYQIVDDEIYMGFSNIKGVGEEISQKIVANQPYTSFEDFLTRFGTDSKVVKPLVMLEKFDDASPKVLWEFYEYFKNQTKARQDRAKRNQKSRDGIVAEMQYLMPSEDNVQEFIDSWMQRFVDLQLEPKEEEKLFCSETVEFFGEKVDDFWKVFKKYRKNVEGYEKKVLEDEPITMASFRPVGNLSEDIKNVCESPIQARQATFYGFGWQHFLEHSPDYVGGRTFQKFEEDELSLISAIECQIVKKVERRESKKGTAYYVAVVEDENWQSNSVIFWEDDYEKFKEELEYWDESLQRGNMLVLRLERPGPGFKSYKFQSPAKHLKSKLIPKDKASDYRLMVMSAPEKMERKVDDTNDKELFNKPIIIE